LEIRYGEWQPDRIVAIARELVALKPDILYTHGDQAIRPAMQTTRTIPIVVGAASDLVGMWAVESLARPGGNVTGVTHTQPELDRKRLELLKEAVPATVRIAFLTTHPTETFAGLEKLAPRLGVRMQNIVASDPGQIEAAFATMAKDGVQAILVQDTPQFSRNAPRVAALALRHRLPTMSQSPRFAEQGGLLQYGADVMELFRRSATYVDRILKGARPSDLPVEQPTKVILIVNLKTARALGLTIPASLLARADHIIE
jgi:putative ABC transport system substrate-binding protein